VTKKQNPPMMTVADALVRVRVAAHNLDAMSRTENESWLTEEDAQARFADALDALILAVRADECEAAAKAWTWDASGAPVTWLRARAEEIRQGKG